VTGEDVLYDIGVLLVPVLIIWMILRSRRQPLWREAYRRLAKNKVALVSIFFLSLYFAVAILDGVGWHTKGKTGATSVIDVIFSRPLERTYSAPLAKITAEAHNPERLNAPGTHLLGTDAIGTDVLYQTIKAAHTAIFIGGLTTLIATPFAIILGLISGYFGKITDDIVQYTYTVFSSVPDVLLLIALILVLGRGVLQICFALGITTWVNLCRLVRGEMLRHRDREYVRAAKALGVGPTRIMIRHVLPNLLPVVIISVTIGFSTIVLTEAILSYLGVGVGPDVASWGNMIDGARDELTRDPVVWWNLIAATIALFGLVLPLNLFADALRDAIDPRLRSA
jgi:peptide/nickel transport system permease protein